MSKYDYKFGTINKKEKLQLQCSRFAQNNKLIKMITDKNNRKLLVNAAKYATQMRRKTFNKVHCDL